METVTMETITIDLNLDINQRLFDNYTPLHLAAQYGIYDMAKKLLEHGANPNLLDNNKLTPLSYARDNQYQDISDLIIAYGGVDSRRSY